VCQSKDLSGGGISLVNMGKKVYFEEESTISMQFTIGDLHLDLMGIVIWVKQMKYDDMDRVTTGVNFTCISEDTRKEIIKRVYLRQIELRKKGVL
jgi:c-di-GMP-binding flagellar brake protein YcgR